MGNSWAKKVADAQASGGGNWMTQHGKYLLVVTGFEGKLEELGTKGFKGESVIARMRVLEAAPNVKTDPNVGPHKVGEDLSFVHNFNTTMAATNLKKILLAIINKSDAEIKTEEAAAIKEAAAKGEKLEAGFIIETLGHSVVSADQPATGVLLRADTYEFTTQGGPNQGKKGLAVNWTHVPQTEEQRAAEREKLMIGDAA